MGVMKDFDIRIRNGGDDAAGAVNELMAELQRRLLELQDSMPRWIPVSERLPDDGRKVLAFDEHFPVVQSARRNGSTWDCEGMDFLKPSHWMPIPAPPQTAE